jgi:hypothetical protein
MSEAKAQAELLKSKYLQQIGDYYDLINPEDLPVLDGIFLYYGKLFNDEVARQLDISGSVASGKIGQLAVPQIIKFGTEYGMALGYEKNNPASVYYDFVNKGVKGVGGKNQKKKDIDSDTPYAYKTIKPNKKMIESIFKWYQLGKAKARTDTQTKKLSAVQSKNRKLKSVSSNPITLQEISTMTAIAIKRDGLKSTKFFDNAIKKVFNQEFYDIMGVALGNDIKLQIVQINNQYKDGYNNK